MYRALTEITIIVHLAFIVFVVAGGLLARRRRWLIPFHLGALGWAVYAEVSPGIVCPLTAAENFFAMRAGIAEYSGDFVAHYLIPVIYQDRLPQRWQYVLIAVVIALNVLLYALVIGNWKRAGMRSTMNHEL